MKVRNLLGLVVLCLCVNLIATAANATVLFKEDFEGTKTMSTYNSGAWTSVTNFTTSDWKNCIGISKDTSVPHGGRQCALLYGTDGSWDTSEMYTGGTMNQTEFWASWWERLSSGYHIDTNHKWFVFRLMNSDGSSDLVNYTNFQCNNGGSDQAASMRVYSQPVDALYGYATEVLPTNTWYQIKVHYKLNTPGSSDGVVQVWIKKSPTGSWEQWHSYSGINIRGSYTGNIDSIRIGGSRSDYPSHGMKYVDDIIVATTEAEVNGSTTGGGTTTADTTPPSVVQGLKVGP